MWTHGNSNIVSIFFRGTSGIDIDLRRVDIDQCPSADNSQLNIFAASDKCKKETTQVSTRDNIFKVIMMKFWKKGNSSWYRRGVKVTNWSMYFPFYIGYKVILINLKY